MFNASFMGCKLLQQLAFIHLVRDCVCMRRIDGYRFVWMEEIVGCSHMETTEYVPSVAM